MSKSKKANCTVGNPELLSRNGEGYMDKTAYDAILNMDNADEKEIERVTRLMRIIRNICTLVGFRIQGRIVLVDEETGRVWR